MDFDSELESLLRQKRNIELLIEKLFAEKYNREIRLSSKKLVADLGEYYFYKAASFFAELKQGVTSNCDCDFTGKLFPEFREKFNLNLGEVRVEVKTRHAQVGNNHLFGIKPQKFDLLAFVALSDDLKCRHIGLIRSSDIQVDSQRRIKYSDYYRNGLVVWKSNDWEEL
jgi:hypothetical protein